MTSICTELYTYRLVPQCASYCAVVHVYESLCGFLPSAKRSIKASGYFRNLFTERGEGKPHDRMEKSNFV